MPKTKLDEVEIQSIRDMCGGSCINPGHPVHQIFLLTKKVRKVSKHLEENRGDTMSTQGFLASLDKRRELLSKLKHNNPDLYLKICSLCELISAENLNN
jgi:ribosomal protein S15